MWESVTILFELILYFWKCCRFDMNTKNSCAIRGYHNVYNVPQVRRKTKGRQPTIQQTMRWAQMFFCLHRIQIQRRKTDQMPAMWPGHFWLCQQRIIHTDKPARWCAIISCSATMHRCHRIRERCANTEAVPCHRPVHPNMVELDTNINTISKIPNTFTRMVQCHNSSINYMVCNVQIIFENKKPREKNSQLNLLNFRLK